MNREMRRLQAKEEERAKKRRKERARPVKAKRERTNVKQFLREVRQEMKKVAWPSRQELTTYTVVVFLTTTFITLVVFGMDWVFNTTVLSLLRSVG